MPSKTKKTSNKKSKKSTQSKLPTLEECGGFTYHYPWNKSKYREACEAKKCFFNYRTKGLLGSYCEDPITVTNRNIEKSKLNDYHNLCAMELGELKTTLQNCNMADNKYYKQCFETYRRKRREALKAYVVDCEDELVIQLPDNLIYKFIKHAKAENIANVKDVYQIKYYQFLCRRNCFNSKLGNNPLKYKMKSWQEINTILESCGIKEDSIFYEQAKLHFETYSCNSPYYYINEMPLNSPNGKQCQTDCDCSSVRRCKLGKCTNTEIPLMFRNRRPAYPNLDLPRGTWKETAKDIRMDRNILIAKLQKRDGSYSYDKVIFGPNDSFSNYDGKFKLDYTTKLPGGTWRDTAKDIEIKNGVLSALLKDKQGTYRYDYIIFNTDICLQNNDGKFEVIIC